ncbi:MAG TPA: hypothetical protein PKO41_04105, partial [Dokdonella sp.]|nr:hypothetical protein [Dokdonella sp.]
RMGDRIRVMVTRCLLGNRSYTIEYAIVKESGEIALTAKTVHVAVMLPDMRATAIPEVLREALSKTH